MKKVLVTYAFIATVFSYVQCYNILMIFNALSESHTILGVSLAEGLIKRGHHVAIVTPFHIKPVENLTHIHLKAISEYQDVVKKELAQPTPLSLSKLFVSINLWKLMNNLFWDEPGIQKIIKEKPNYDLVILMSFYNDALLGLSHHLEVPTIFFSPFGTVAQGNKYMANPNMVYISNTMFTLHPKGFFDRLVSVSVTCIVQIVVDLIIQPFQQAILKKHLPHCPPLEDLKRNVSLMLVNSHFSIETARPYVPNMIQIGGFHIRDPKELPPDIKGYLDTAEQGAILFSLGSNVLISSIEEKKREAIVKVLGEMAPIKVLFKSELDHADVPKNVMVKKWLPQSDILAHPKIKVFISHGGLGGITETVYHGVPILAIPFFGDQMLNVAEAETSGYAAMIQYDDLSEDLFRQKLMDVIENPRYRENIRRRSSLLKEQPVKPMDNAIFWVEHIIKYGGGSHLRNAGMDLTWFEFYMVDIYIFYSIILCLILLINYYTIKFVCRIVKAFFSKEKLKLKTT